jgi:CBS domain-containing protein
MSPFVEAETTLKDALSMLLASEVQAALVVDRDDRLVGMITVAQITSTLQAS